MKTNEAGVITNKQIQRLIQKRNMKLEILKSVDSGGDQGDGGHQSDSDRTGLQKVDNI